MQLMSQLVDEAMPPQNWQKDCDATLHDCHDGDEPPGFPFFDNMIDLQFNVRSEDKMKPACDENSPKANLNTIEEDKNKVFERTYGW